MAEEKPTREKLLYDFYFDEAARLGQRTDWFLIFHAILLEAFFASQDFVPKLVIGPLGWLTSYLWFMTGYRQRWLSRHLGECMAHAGLMGPETAGLFNNIFAMRRKGLPTVISWPMPVPTFAVIIPFAFAAAWFSLLLWVGRGRSLLVVLLSLAVASLSTLWIVALGSGPKISRVWVDPLASDSLPAEPNEGREQGGLPPRSSR